MFNKRLFPLFELSGEIGAPSEPEIPSVDGEGEPSGDGNAPTPSQDDVTKQESFAKRLKEQTEARLAEERQKWEQEQAEKFKNYDDYRKVTEYFQRTNGFNDVMTLKEEIELAELREQAEEQKVPVEVMKRLQELEEKANRVELLEKQQQEQQSYQQFQTELDKFAKENQVDSGELADFMFEHQVGNFNVALKAMKADQLQKQLETAKEEAVKEYLKSKEAPKAEGSGTAGVQTSTPKTWEESRQAALDRLRSARAPQ